MTKDLVIPVKEENQMLVSDMSEFFKGITIGYFDNIPVGIITFRNKVWEYTDTNDCIYFNTYAETIDYLVDSCTCNKFKVIEFDEE